MESPQRPSDLADDLRALASALETLDLSGPRPSRATQTRDRIVRSIRGFLIPRLVASETPLTVAFAGPTGSGKSTMVNSLSGLEVSPTGPLRPTTTRPVVLCSEGRAASYERISGIVCDVVEGRAPVLERMSLVDTPDIDSTSEEHRVTAEILIDSADVVVFVTSALRYADRVPWEVLRRAASRGAPIVYVLNRMSPGSGGAVVDFRARLAAEGLEPDIVRVAEHHLQPWDESVPPLAVRELRKRLAHLAVAAGHTRRQAFDRVLATTVDEVFDLADSLETRGRGSELRRDRIERTLAEGARHLRLEGLWAGIGPKEPPDGRWATWAWKWRNRLSERESAILRDTMRRRLVAVVEADIRRLGVLASDEHLISPEETSEIRRLAGEGVDEWFDQLDGLVRVGRRGHHRLAAAVLAKAVTEARPTRASRALFPDESLVVRAYRGLAVRLESIYQQMGETVARSSEPAPADPDRADRLREMAGMILARSHFADA